MKIFHRNTRPLPRAAGFSLIEMLAVIVLIGIVAGIVVQQVGKNVDKGKYGAGKAQVQMLAGKIEGYALDNGSPPARLEDLLTKPGNSSNWVQGARRTRRLRHRFPRQGRSGRR